MNKVIVIGSGGHAKIVVDILHEMKDIEIIGITSTSLKTGSVFCGHPVIGDDNVIKKYKNQGINFVVMGLGGFRDNILRESVFVRIKSMGMSFANAIHPSAIISRTVKLGEGVTIFQGVIINTEVQIGNNVIIATGSTIDHETIIGDHVLISSGVTVGGYSLIKKGTLLALGSKVISGLIIGSNVTVAAGAVVINDLKDNCTVFGNPARILPLKKT